jgi:hypothetical protein
MNDQYVDLPNGIVSSLTHATFEVWLVWIGGASWQRIFDFGDTMRSGCVAGTASGSEGERATCGRTYLFMTPHSGTSLRAAFLAQPGTPTDEMRVETTVLPVGVSVHLALVVDDEADTLFLYRNGTLANSNVSFTGSLSAINDINNWLGRSQFVSDESFAGTLDEFRIYNVALTEGQIALSFSAGADAPFLQ